MTLKEFKILDLKTGDYVSIMTEKGEMFPGNFDNNFDVSKLTFKFRNHSNGQSQTIEITKLQKIDLHKRA